MPGQENNILNQTLNTLIQNHLVEGSIKKIKIVFQCLIRKQFILISNVRD